MPTQTLIRLIDNERCEVRSRKGNTYPCVISKKTSTDKVKTALKQNWTVDVQVSFFEGTAFALGFIIIPPVKVSKEELKAQEELYLLGGDY
jgi:hypothetical protein